MNNEEVTILKKTHETVIKIEKILIGDIDRPEKDGLISKVSRNTNFRESFDKIKVKLYYTIAGLIAISIWNIFGMGFVVLVNNYIK